MPYLIDGHNLIGKIPGLRLDDLDDEKQLIELLQEFCQRTRKDVEVYFDKASAGHARASVLGRVTARFVREGGSADSTISNRLKRLGKEATNWTVVSSDNQVIAAAKRARARVISSTEFVDHLIGREVHKEERVSTELSTDEVEDWLSLFNEGEEGD